MRAERRDGKSGRGPRGSGKPSAGGPLRLLVVASLVAAAVVVTLALRWGGSPPPSAAGGSATAQTPGPPGMDRLLGRWARTDGNYTIEILGAAPDGTLVMPWAPPAKAK